MSSCTVYEINDNSLENVLFPNAPFMKLNGTFICEVLRYAVLMKLNDAFTRNVVPFHYLTSSPLPLLNQQGKIKQLKRLIYVILCRDGLGGTPITCRYVNRPPFYANLTPNDLLFLQSTPHPMTAFFFFARCQISHMD